MVYIREDLVLETVAAFSPTGSSVPNGPALLAADLARTDDRQTQARAAARQRLGRTVTDLARRQENNLRQAQTADPADPFSQGLRQSYNTLDADRRAALAQIEELDTAEAAQPARPNHDSLALLDALPMLALTLDQAPEQLQRRLFEITQLVVQVRPETEEVTMMIKLPAAAGVRPTLDVAEEIADATRSDACGSARYMDALRAPNGIRTRATALKGRRPGPLDDGGPLR